MGWNLDCPPFLNPTSGGNTSALGIMIDGFQGLMKRTESELNLEAFLCMSGDERGEGECPDGDLEVKGGCFSAKGCGDDDHSIFLQGQGSMGTLSSCGHLTMPGWSPPAPKGSSPALTYGYKNSEEHSDDEDDMETEAGQSEQSMGSNELKRIKRMASNRESARRSRRRKQDHLNELETEVDKLRGQHSTLYNQLTEIKQQCENAATNNRVLKSDVESLRATVKLAQDLVARGPLADIVNQRLLQQASLIPPLSAWNVCWPFDIQPMLDGTVRYQAASSLTGSLTIGAESDSPGIRTKTDGSLPMQRTTSMEQLQNRICGEGDAWPWDASPITKQS